MCEPRFYKKARLGEIARLNYGKSPQYLNFGAGTIPVVGTGGDVRYADKYLVNHPSVIIARKGTLGNPSFIEGKFWPIDTTFFLSHFKNVLPKYLFYLLNTIDLTTLNESTGVPSLSRYTLNRIELLIPDPEYQVYVIGVLSDIDQQLAQTEALITKHERLRAGLLQDLLTYGIDQEGQIRSEQTHEFKDSPIGLIPAEWTAETIDNIAAFVGSGVTPTGGNSVYAQEGIVFLRSQNVYNDGLWLEDVAYITEAIDNMMKRSRVQQFDVLLNITGASIGRCCFVPKGFPQANVNQHVCIIRQKRTNYENSAYLSAVLASPIGQRQISALNAGGN